MNRWLIILLVLLIVGCDVIDPDVYGCTDTTACNFNADANIFDNSCEYPESTLKKCDGSCSNGYVELWNICRSVDLTYLNLDWNQLTGEIPSEIGNLTNLTYLHLGHNQLTGEIPSWIGSLTNLINLGLFDNQLTGEIPSEIGNLTNLTTLILDNNQLTGDIPQEVCDLINSNGLYMSGILTGNNLTNTCD